MSTTLNEILLFSGGLDSYIAWHFLGQPRCLYVDLGHKYAGDEWFTIEKLHIKCEYVKMKEWGLWEQSDAFIPLRNMELAMQGALRANRIWLIVQEGERTVKDRDEFFFSNIGKLMTHCLDRDISVATPFEHKTKAEMVSWYLSVGLPIENLYISRSCYRSGEKECGNCNACFRKFIALEYNDLSTTGHFLLNPKTFGNENYKPHLANYDYKREHEMRTVMGW